MGRPPADWPITEYVMRCGTPAALASAWNFWREHSIASKGMRASGGPCWVAIFESGAAFAHQVSPYVGPRPGEIGVPSHGGTADALAAATSATSRAASRAARRVRRA